MFMPYVMGRMKSLWGEDCEQFKPDRFLGTREPTSAKFTAFKHGPRTVSRTPVLLRCYVVGQHAC